MSNKVRVALIGIGNCASAMVQGVYYYMDAPVDMPIPGLMHTVLSDYHVGDIEFSAAFDVVEGKVGLPLSQAIFAYPNNTAEFVSPARLYTYESEMPVVHKGMTHDGLGKYPRKKVKKAFGPSADVAKILKDTGTDVVVNFMPVGSEMATKWYVEQAIDAGCAFVNGIPVFIASSEYWCERFRKAGLPVIGDDIKSQVGATIVHRVLTNLFKDRGVKIDRTYQLNFGGNMDFYNMLERERLESKKVSKTGAVTSQLPYDIGEDNIHVGPSDYVPWLTDRKWCHIRMEGSTFGNLPLNLELKLEVWDSPNSAGVMIDAVRCAKVALDRGDSGSINAISAYFMKTPPTQVTDDKARRLLDNYLGIYPATRAVTFEHVDKLGESFSKGFNWHE